MPVHAVIDNKEKTLTTAKRLVLVLLKPVQVITAVLLCFSVHAQQWHHDYVPHSRDITDLFISTGGIIVAVGGHETNDKIETIIKSVDAGITWDIISDSIDNPWLTSCFFTSDSVGFASGFEGKIKKTVNQGTTWTTLNSGIADNLNSIFFTGSDVGYCAGGNKATPLQTILKTTDGGQNWNVIWNVPDFWLKEIYFTDQNIGFAAGDSGVVISTGNAGSSWQTVTVPIIRNYNSIFFTSPDTGYIAGGNYINTTILKTTDGGANWIVSVDQTGGQLNDIYFLDALTGYAVGKKGVFLKTIDGGINWIQQNVPELDAIINLNAVIFKSPDYGILMAQYGDYFITHNFQSPVVQTVGITAVSYSEAILSGTVNTNGVASNVSFIYSTDPSLSNPVQTSSQFLNSTSPTAVNIYAPNLQPNTYHYFTCVVSNITGTYYGDTLSFITSDYVNSGFLNIQPATSVTGSSCVLNGVITNLPYPSSIYFEYHLQGQSSTLVATTPGSINDLQEHYISAPVSGLLPDTSYFYRIKAVSNSGILYSDYLQVYTGGNIIPNHDFENWTVQNAERPVDWDNIFGYVTKVSPGNSGSYALKAESTPQSYGGVTHGGILQFGGTAYSSRPDSMSIMMKYNIVSGDTAFILLFIKKNGQFISNNRYPLTGSSQSSFTEIRHKINYSSPETPDTLFIGIISTNPFDGEIPIFGSWVIADDLNFTGTAEQLTNSGFEDWEINPCTLLDNWGYQDPYNFDYYENPDNSVVKKTTDSQNGTFAAELTDIDISGYMARGRMSTFTPVVLPTDGESYPSFELDHKPFALNGYFKYFPSGNDTLLVTCTVYKNSIPIGTGFFSSWFPAEYVFMPFSAKITYSDTTIIPDSAYIELKAYGSISPQHGGSHLIIDNLRFDGFASDILISTRSEKINSEMLLYPNPGKDHLVVYAENLNENFCNIEIHDMAGRIVLNAQTSEVNNGKVKAEINTEHIEAGVYLVVMKTSTGCKIKKWIKR